MQKYIHKYYFMGNYHCQILNDKETAIEQKNRLGGYFIKYQVDSNKCKYIIKSCISLPNNRSL